jgi:hypothetical protein
MKILLDIFKPSQLEETPSHFFLFANREKNNKTEIALSKHRDFHSHDSVCIIFNTGNSLTNYSIVKSHPNKWLFFRLLSKDKKYGHFFRNLDLLSEYIFQKYFFIPDILDPEFRSGNFLIPTIDYLISKNIDLTNLCHFSIFSSEILTGVKKRYPKNSKGLGTMSSGLWVYLYLRGQYPKARFTIVDYTGDIDREYHNAFFEKGFWASEILSGRCHAIESFLD